MRKIHLSMIQSIFSVQVVQKGLDYYEQLRVTDLIYDKPHQIWTSRVHGRKTYFVEVNYQNVNNGVLTVYCDCPQFKTYEECKHVVATIFAVNQKIDSKNKYTKTAQANQLLQLLTAFNISNEVNVLTDKTPMKIQYICKLDYFQTISIELKTGIDHCYVVRDIVSFLNDVFTNNHHYFTKRFTYDPNHHYFLQQDLEVLKLLQKMLMNERVYEAKYEQTLSSSYKRTVTVSPVIISQLLQQLKKRDSYFFIKGIEYKTIDFIEYELPFNFKVQIDDNNNYYLDLDRLHEAIFIELYNLLFLNGCFYYLTKEQAAILNLIFQTYMNDQTVTISKKMFQSFFSNALPSLKQLGTVEFTKNIQEHLIDEALVAQLKLQISGHLLIGHLKYKYGPYEIDPFQNNTNDALIIRDINQEQAVMELIEKAQFHYNGKELYLDCIDEERLYKFLYEILPLLEEKVTLYLAAEVRQLIQEDVHVSEAHIEVDYETNLLEIGFSIENVTNDDIEQLLQAVIEKRKFYQTTSGAIISLLEDDFLAMQKLFSELPQSQLNIDDKKVQLPIYYTNQIDAFSEIKKSYHPSFKKLIKALNQPELENYPLPNHLNAKLRDYQVEGYQWLKTLSHYSLGGILADEMGLGKTIQMIALLLSEIRRKPHLVIVPASVVYNWRNEIYKFAPNLTVKAVTGSPHHRLKQLAAGEDADVWITSYGTLRQDIEHYKNFHFQTLILDEAQYVKNYATKSSKAVRHIQAEKRFALSGTPIENSLDDLWAIFQVVLPGLVPDQRTFNHLTNEQVRLLTKPFILRRLKRDVLHELPDKIESVHASQLTEAQKKLYIGYLKKIQGEAKESLQDGSFHENRMKILAGLTRLRQICCHPSLFLHNYDGRSGKLDELIDFVITLKESGKRPLIFSQFTSMHELIKVELEKQNIAYFYLHGQTKSLERVEMSERFNRGEKDVFLISLRAGGTGLNLTGADTVILYDLWWNPAVEDQATDRAHRYGQQEVVQVVRFITEGTIEEKIYELQQEKRELIGEVIQSGRSNLSSLTEEDVRQLLNL